MKKSKTTPKVLNYAFDCPLLFAHENVNGGAPLTGHFIGNQEVSFNKNGDIAIKSFSANLTLPAYNLNLEGKNRAYFSDVDLSVTLASINEFCQLDVDEKGLNKAGLNKSTGVLNGLIGLKVEMPGDDSFTYCILSFTCSLFKNDSLIFGGQGLILNGLYTSGILACCGIKTPAPACTVTIATTTPSTKTVTAG
ncbi:hypothetical protein ACFL0H_14850, partial [Thermodesulfobacteriota bacterium]